MNPAAVTARNLAGASWQAGRRVATFAAARPGFGIVDDHGRMLSTGGEAPSTWSTLRAARTVAQHRAWPDRAVWLEPIKTP